MLASQGDEPDAGALDVLGSLCTTIVDRGMADTVGNARFARELCSKASAQRDLRLYSAHVGGTPPRQEMVTVLAWDIVAAHDELMEARRGGDAE